LKNALWKYSKKLFLSHEVALSSLLEEELKVDVFVAFLGQRGLLDVELREKLLDPDLTLGKSPERLVEAA
jgi:hypothetical protein